MKSYKNKELLRIECSGLLNLQIFGPPPLKKTSLNNATSSYFSLNTGYKSSVKIKTAINAPLEEYKNSTKVEPFLFEETPYEICIELLGKGITSDSLELVCPDRDFSENLEPLGLSQKNIYLYQINFRSQIGLVDFHIKTDGKTILKLSLEVFPSKLDYRSDLPQIRADIENEIRDLAFAMGKMTWHRATRRRGVRAGEIEWLENIKQLMDDFQKAYKQIELFPKAKIIVDEYIQKADRPTRFAPSVRRYVRSHTHLCSLSKEGQFEFQGEKWHCQRLPAERKRLSYDTAENRFIKWALKLLLKKIRHSKLKITASAQHERNITQIWGNILDKSEMNIRKNIDAAFLENVKDGHPGVVQSLTLYNAPGYREFYRIFIDMLQGLAIYGGPFELSEKDLYTLYEMWCFIKLGGILRTKYNIKPEQPDWLKIDRNGIGVNLTKGVTSSLLLKSDEGEEFQLTYNLKEETATGSVYPDNVLEIRKKGNRLRPYSYIFDAKYRISEDEDYINRYKAPGPPIDTINRMHAYRDQITYQSLQNESAGKPDNWLMWDMGYRRYFQKNIGAFVLYPYADDNSKNLFLKSIDEIGIGGLPFLPSRTPEVENLLDLLIHDSSDTIDDNTVQLSSENERQQISWAHQYGLMGIVRSKEQLDFIKQKKIYHMPYTPIKGVRLRADFVLLLLSDSTFKNKSGVRYSANVKNFIVSLRQDISPQPPPGHGRQDDWYIWFELDQIKELEKPLFYKKGEKPAYFRTTTMLAFKSAISAEELSLIREPEFRLYSELQRAGYHVKIREDHTLRIDIYNISDLRLVFILSDETGKTMNIRFRPETSQFYANGGNIFDFHDLMFNPAYCMQRVSQIMGD